MNSEQIDANSTMGEILQAFPGAQRALFRRYHIGGCSSCGFQPTETLAEVCQRNENLDVNEVLSHIRQSHEQDSAILIEPKELDSLRQREPNIPLLDIRSKTEFESARIEGSVLMTQAAMQEILGKWPRDRMFVIVDHQGKQSLDAAAYFLGHAFQNVRCLRGGIDAWAEEVDSAIPRYALA